MRDYKDYKADSKILAITVRLRTRDGEDHTIEIDPKTTDGLFWSMEAVDSFLVPFYSVTEGFEFAADLRGKIVNGDTGLFIVPMIHKKLCRILLPHFDRGDPEPHLREVP